MADASASGSDALGNSPLLMRPVEAVEQAEVLDGPGKAIGNAVRGRLGPGPFKDVISGTWLGHALHPLLTDLVIGSFLSATVLDLLGGDRDGKAAERLIAVGIASYPATALTGANDWADSEPADSTIRRVGLAHAGANTAGLLLYAASLAARRRGARRRGRQLGLAGSAALGVGGHFGGHLSLTKGVGPNQTAFDAGPEDWTDAAAAADLNPGEPLSAVASDTPVMLLRHGDAVHAIHDRCSHRGCSLSDGEIEGESVVCVCHGSRFRLYDGSVERGPATVAQPAFDTREAEGRIQVRRRS